MHGVTWSPFPAFRLPCPPLVPPSRPGIHPSFIVCLAVLFPAHHMVGITQLGAFSDWLLSTWRLRLRPWHVFSSRIVRFSLVLRNIAFSGWSVLHIPTHLLKDISGGVQVLVIRNEAAGNIYVRGFVWIKCSALLGKHQERSRRGPWQESARFCKKPPHVFQSRPISHSQQPWMVGPVAACPRQDSGLCVSQVRGGPPRLFPRMLFPVLSRQQCLLRSFKSGCLFFYC